MKNFKENLSYFAQAEQTSKIKAGLWVEFSISTAALVKIKYCFLPSQTQEVGVELSCSSDAKGRDYGREHYTDDYAKPESHCICRDWRGLFKCHVPLLSLRHIGISGPKLNGLNRYMWALARSRRQGIKMLWKPMGTWKEWIQKKQGGTGKN